MRRWSAILAATGLYAGIIAAPSLLSAQTLVLDPKTGKLTNEATDPNAPPVEGAVDENSVEMKSALQAATDPGATPVPEVGTTGSLLADSTISQDTRIGSIPSMAITTITRSSDSAEKARLQSEVIARRDGLAKILRQQVPDRAEALLQMLDDEKIRGMVGSLQAAGEQSSVSTYRATLTVKFDPKKLEALMGTKLKKAEVPVPLIPGQGGDASLVIPVWKEADQIKIWEPENAWRKALNRAASQESKNRLVMPYGDPIDQLAVTAVKVPTLKFAEVAHLANRYGTSDVLVVEATPIAGNGLNLTIIRMDAKGSSQQQQLITVPPTQSRDALLASAASYVAQMARQQFQTGREAEVQEEAALHRIRAQAPITRAADWASMRQRLSAMPMIESLVPVDIGPDQVEMEIAFRGSPDAFGNALKSANIHVTPQGSKLILGFYPTGN